MVGAKKNLCRDFKRISTKGIDFPEPYIAKVPLGTGVGNPPELVDYPFMLPHEVLAHLVAKRGMDVKHAGCVDTRVDQRLGDMKRSSARTSTCTMTLVYVWDFMVMGCHTPSH